MFEKNTREQYKKLLAQIHVAEAFKRRMDQKAGKAYAANDYAQVDHYNDLRERTGDLLGRIGDRIVMNITGDGIRRPTLNFHHEWEWTGHQWELKLTRPVYQYVRRAYSREHEGKSPEYYLMQDEDCVRFVAELLEERIECSVTGHLYADVRRQRVTLKEWPTRSCNSSDWHDFMHNYVIPKMQGKLEAQQ